MMTGCPWVFIVLMWLGLYGCVHTYKAEIIQKIEIVFFLGGGFGHKTAKSGSLAFFPTFSTWSNAADRLVAVLQDNMHVYVSFVAFNTTSRLTNDVYLNLFICLLTVTQMTHAEMCACALFWRTDVFTLVRFRSLVIPNVMHRDEQIWSDPSKKFGIEQ